MNNRTTSFDIGRVLGSTFAVIGKHPVVFLGLSLIISGVPFGLLQYFTLNEETLASIMGPVVSGPADYLGQFIYSMVIIGAITFIAYTLFITLLQAMLIVATVRDMKQQDVSISVCFMQAIRRLLPLIGLAIIGIIGIMFGFMFFVIPGVILFLMWIVAAPVMMTENLGIIGSLGRSADLTSGSKGMIFLLVIIFIVASGMIKGIAEGTALYDPAISIIVIGITETILAAVQAAGIAAIYVELRTVKEGPLTNRLSEVFA